MKDAQKYILSLILKNVLSLDRHDIQYGGQDAWMGTGPNGDYLSRDEVLAVITAAIEGYRPPDWPREWVD